MRFEVAAAAAAGYTGLWAIEASAARQLLLWLSARATLGCSRQGCLDGLHQGPGLSI